MFKFMCYFNISIRFYYVLKTEMTWIRPGSQSFPNSDTNVFGIIRGIQEFRFNTFITVEKLFDQISAGI